MMSPCNRWFFGAVLPLALVLGTVPQARAQSRKAPENNFIVRLLDEPVEMKDFQQPMSMREALGLLMEKFETKGKPLPIVVDVASFRRENPESSVYDVQVNFQPYPKHFALAQVLQMMVAKAVQPEATFLIRNGAVVITTKKERRQETLLKREVIAEFLNTPFTEAMEELSAVTGASIVVDLRLGDKLKSPVTASLRNDVTLEAALRMLSDMVDLKPVFLPGGVYITHPFNAENIQRELREYNKSQKKDAQPSKTGRK
jgi:hypothetical protein